MSDQPEDQNPLSDIPNIPNVPNLSQVRGAVPPELGRLADALPMSAAVPPELGRAIGVAQQGLARARDAVRLYGRLSRGRTPNTREMRVVPMNKPLSKPQSKPSTYEAYPSYRFYVELKNVPMAVFTEVSGLQIETQVYEYAEGGNNSFIHRLPSGTKYTNLVLKRGMTASNELFRWYQRVAQGYIEREGVAVIMYDVGGKPLLRWDFEGAYPVKWIGPQLNAGTNAAAVETLELAHHGIKIV